MNRSAATLASGRVTGSPDNTETCLRPDSGSTRQASGRVAALVKRLASAALVLGLLAAARCLGAVGDDPGNPTGVSGSYNGDVTTAGDYDPFTGNARRVVTDLTVPGAGGSYGLGFTRVFNSRLTAVDGDYPYFGDAVNWRHSYQWSLASGTDTDGNTCYTIAYPDGRVINYCVNRSYQPASETYLRGPVGTQDRFVYLGDTSMYLHLQDGGIVTFKKVGQAALPNKSIYGRATSIKDPYGAVTLLTYVPGNPSFLSRVSEPGGRTLSFSYITSNSQSVLQTVTASNGRSVTYNYGTKGTHAVNGANASYNVLLSAVYNYEPSVNGNYNLSASYTYDVDSNDQTTPVLLTCLDPHYGGAMVQMRYAYVATNGVVGQVLEEQHPTSGTAGERVSHCDRYTSANTTTETRGDGPQRTFSYGQPSTSAGTTNAKNSQLTSSTDYQNNTRYLTYYSLADKDTYGRGNVHTSVDALGHTTTYATDPLTGKTTGVTLPDGRTRSYQWMSLGKESGQYYLYKTTDERNQTTTYQRDGTTGLVNEIDYPDGGRRSFLYKVFTAYGYTFSKVQCVTDQRGAQAIYGFDETDEPHGGSGFAGLVTSVTRAYADGYGNVPRERTRLFYDNLDQLTKVIDPRGVTELYTYNARGQVTRVTHAADNTHVDCTYDDLGNGTSVTDELGHTATTAYDDYRRVLSVTVPVNDGTNTYRFEAFVYDHRDANGNATASAHSHTSATWGISWVWSLKGAQRLYTANEWVSDEYAGLTVQGVNGTVAPYPGNGYVHQSYSYNALGQVQKTTDAQGQLWKNTYDTSGRAATVQDPLSTALGDNHTATYNYFAPGENDDSGVPSAGLFKSVVGPMPDLAYAPVTSKTTRHDAMGRTLEAKDPRSVAFQSSFNVAGDLVSQSDGAQDAGQHRLGYNRDQLGRPINLSYPDGTTEAWKYDTSGNVATYKNRAGATKTLSYDMRNRLTYAFWSDGSLSPVAYYYDAASRLTQVQNAVANLLFTYDDAGALLSESSQHGDQSAALVTRYVHDVDGNVVVVIHPDGAYPQFHYDDQQRCTGMYAGSTTFSQYNYSGNWLVGRWIAPCVYTGYGHQLNGRVNDVWHYHGDAGGGHSSNASISRRLYGFAPDGHASWCRRDYDGGQSGSTLEANPDGRAHGDVFYYRADGSLSDAYRDVAVNGDWPGVYTSNQDGRVDPANILTSGGAPSYHDTYAYDAAGNRTQAAQMGQGTIGYTPDGENRYLGSLYDANGNTTDSAVGYTYFYDAENQLVGIRPTSTKADPNTAVALFAYDGLGRLAVRNIFGVYTGCYYAGAQRIEERDAGNALRYRYFSDAPGSDALLFREGLYGQLWYLSDLAGNTTHLVDGAGTVQEAYLYDAYGTPSFYDATGAPRPGNAGALDNRYLWHGASAYEWHGNVALYYCRARFYLPQHGRFLQPDPAGQAGGLNLYSYCNNDPINGDDPSGLDDQVARIVVTDYGRGSNDVIPAGSIDAPIDPPAGMLPGGFEISGYLPARGGYEVVGTVPGVKGQASAPDPSAPDNVVRPLIYSAPSVGRGISTALLGFIAGLNPFWAAFVASQEGGGYGPLTPGGWNRETTANAITGVVLMAAAMGSSAVFEGGAPESAPEFYYHYTSVEESMFADGFNEGSSVTDKLYTNPFEAASKLGIRGVPNKVIPIRNIGQFVPNKPPTVQAVPERNFIGGGKDFINPQRVPPSQILPAQPIEGG